MRQDITKNIQAQMMRATDVGHPPLDGIMGQVADAVKRWEMRRGIRPVESWFEVHRKAKAEAIRAEKLTRLDTLNTLSRVRTLVEEARRTGGDEAAAALRAQFKRERYERKRRQQTERYRKEKAKVKK